MPHDKIGMLYICTGKLHGVLAGVYRSFEEKFLPGCENTLSLRMPLPLSMRTRPAYTAFTRRPTLAVQHTEAVLHLSDAGRTLRGWIISFL